MKEIVIVNARIRTADPRRPWADALIARDGIVTALGSSAEARKRASNGAEVLDARGATIVGASGDLARGATADFDIVDASGAVVRRVRGGAIVAP